MQNHQPAEPLPQPFPNLKGAILLMLGGWSLMLLTATAVSPFLGMQGTAVPGPWRWNVGLWGSYVKDPLAADGQEVIGHRHVLLRRRPSGVRPEDFSVVFVEEGLTLFIWQTYPDDPVI